jgi:hypothetical protein
MRSVFGKGGSKGREATGLRFATIERIDLLDYEGAELLLIASHGDEEGLKASLGEGAGEGKLTDSKTHEAVLTSSSTGKGREAREQRIDRGRLPRAITRS